MSDKGRKRRRGTWIAVVTILIIIVLAAVFVPKPVARFIIADELDAPEIAGADSGDALFAGWGSTYGSIAAATTQLLEEGKKVGHLHLRWLNPLPSGLEEIFARYRHIIVPELNFGQLVRVLRDRYLVDAVPVSQVRGQPFKVEQLAARISSILEASK